MNVTMRNICTSKEEYKRTQITMYTRLSVRQWVEPEAHWGLGCCLLEWGSGVGSKHEVFQVNFLFSFLCFYHFLLASIVSEAHRANYFHSSFQSTTQSITIFIACLKWNAPWALYGLLEDSDPPEENIKTTNVKKIWTVARIKAPPPHQVPHPNLSQTLATRANNMKINFN